MTVDAQRPVAEAEGRARAHESHHRSSVSKPGSGASEAGAKADGPTNVSASTWHPPRGRAAWKAPAPSMKGATGRFFMRSILAALGGDVLRVHGVERLAPHHDPFILVLNHSTKLEALLMPALTAIYRHGRVIPFIADWNIALIPGLAPILKAGDTILLVRKPAKPAILNVFKPWFERKGPAFERAATMLRAGRSVGLFPEGTTNRHPGRLLRGFEGAARLSLTTGCPLLPVGIRFPGHPKDRPICERSPMEIHVGERLRPAETVADPHRDQVRAWHAVMMQELGRLSGKEWNAAAARRKQHGLD